MSSGACAWPGGSPVADWALPSRPCLSLKDRAASIPCGLPQFLFDSEQPVVLGRAVGAGQRARLDLAGVQAHGQVRDRDVLGLSGPVVHDGRVARSLRHLDRLQGFRQRADLVQLDEDRVPNALRNPLREDLRVGHEDVVANELHSMPQPLGEHLPALPVLLAQSVLDRDDRIAPDEALIISDHILAGPPGLRLALHHVPAVLVELAGRGIQRQRQILARRVPRRLDGLHDERQGLLIRAQVGGKAPFIPHCGAEAFFLQQAFQGVEDFGGHPDRVRECVCPHRHNHELLEVQVVVRVCAAVDHVHQRNRQVTGARPAQGAIQGQPRFLGRGLRHGQRHAQDRIRAQFTLVWRTVKGDHRAVDGGLVPRIHAEELGGQHLLHVGDSLADTLAEIALLVAVAQLEGLARTGGRAGGNRRAPPRAGLQHQVRLDCRVPPRVQDLPRPDLPNPTHPASFLFSNSFTFPGFALPPEAFITCPTKNPNTCSLPLRYCNTCCWFLAITSSMIFTSAPSSETCVSPLAFTISEALLPVLNISSSTAFAIGPLTSPLCFMSTNSCKLFGGTGLYSMGIDSVPPFSEGLPLFNKPSNSTLNQLLVSFPISFGENTVVAVAAWK